MNRITAFAAIALMTFAATVHAQTARKVTTLETGKGGIEVKVSLPEFVTDPMDFSGNPGVAKVDVSANGVHVKGQEARFTAPLGQTGWVDYRVSMVKTDSKTDTGKVVELTTKFLKTVGQKFSDAKEIDTQYPILPTGDNHTYLICSQPVFEQPKKERDCTIIEAAVTKDKKQSVVMMATIIENDVEAYNANPEKFLKRANKAFNDMMENSKVKLLP